MPNPRAQVIATLNEEGTFAMGRHADQVETGLRAQLSRAWPFEAWETEGGWIPCKLSQAWVVVIEAYALGATREKVNELIQLWNLRPAELPALVRHYGYHLDPSGPTWIATYGEAVFTDADPLAAIAGLVRCLLLSERRP